MNQLATKPKWRKKEGKNHSKVSNQQHSTKRVSTVKSAEESSAAIQPQVSRAWRNWYVFNHTTGFLKQAIFTYFAEKSSFTFILHFLLPLHCIVLLFAKCLRVCTNLWLVLGVGVAIDYRFVAIGGWWMGVSFGVLAILVWRNAQACIFTVLLLVFCTRSVHAHEGTLCFTYNLFLFFLQLMCCLSCGFFLWFSGLVSFTINIETIAVSVVTLTNCYDC